jgi:hypothetical protein
VGGRETVFDAVLVSDAVRVLRRVTDTPIVALTLCDTVEVALSSTTLRDFEDVFNADKDFVEDHVGIGMQDIFAARPPTIGANGASNTTSMYPRIDDSLHDD